MRLSNKTAIITGGASGFGAGIARKFVAEGARVLIADLNAEMGAALAQELGEAADFCPCDVSQDASVAALKSQCDQIFGHLDILINNAGITHARAPLEEVDEEAFDRVFAVNAKSVFLTARHFVAAMKARQNGVILNIASTAGISPRPSLNWYNASKGWMITATKTMAIELAPFGIRVNALNPVAGETPLLASFMGSDTPETRNAFLSTIPLGRFSTPQDLANAACFLCSDEASMITGAGLEVDGGRCI